MLVVLQIAFGIFFGVMASILAIWFIMVWPPRRDGL